MTLVRSFTAGENIVQLRAKDDGTSVIEGQAIKYNSQSPWYGDWAEIIEKDAAKDADTSDVVALFNHDRSLILGRNVAGTLELVHTDEGLNYRIHADAEITYVANLLKSIKRGDVRGSSFAFELEDNGYEWKALPDGKYLHVVKRMSVIRDVSPVTNPFYPDTTASVKRSLDEFKQALQTRDISKSTPLSIRDREVKFYSIYH